VKLGSQCVAFDFVNSNGHPLIVEISYGFAAPAYINCPGYWDKDMNFYGGHFIPQRWILEDILMKF